MTVVREAREGEHLWFGGSLMTLKAGHADTDGAFLMYEMSSGRGKVTPLHTHPAEDESFYVLEGELLVHDDGREVRVGPGDFASIPRGTPHAFMVTSEVARYLVLITPGPAAAEQFYRDGGEPAPRAELPPDTELDIARISASAELHGSVQILGPPPFTPVPA